MKNISNKYLWLVVSVVCLTIGLAIPAQAISSPSNSNLSITWNENTHTPSFIRLDTPQSRTDTFPVPASSIEVQATAAEFLRANSNLLQIGSPDSELELVGQGTDNLGYQHLTYRQVLNGIEVYNGFINIHFGPDAQTVVAVSSSFVPKIKLASTMPSISAQASIERAKALMPEGSQVGKERLTIFSGYRSKLSEQSRLTWVVELKDSSAPAYERYFIDAQTGVMLDHYALLNLEKNAVAGTPYVETYNTYHTSFTPGILKRTNEQPATGDADVDNAHNFAMKTYQYFYNTFTRDSLDGAGEKIISTAHYGLFYKNAFWDGSQVVYGDGIIALDVTAHELTHGIVDHNGGLTYRFESGALNEAFADIFGAMVDRDDWLIGEDLPASILDGENAMRDLSNPERLGYPAHTDDWVQTCSDNQGVHTNSTIVGKGYYNIAQIITKQKVEQIFYRALTVYLQNSPDAGFADLVQAALRAAEDLYGKNAEYAAVQAGLGQAGLSETWNAPVNDCPCGASTSLMSLQDTVQPLSDLNILGNLYTLRSGLMSTAPAGKYYQRVYEAQTARIAALSLLYPSLSAQGRALLYETSTGIAQLNQGNADEIVTQANIDHLVAYLDELAAKDLATPGGGTLARAIEVEKAKINWPSLIGMTYTQAKDYLNWAVFPNRVFVPMLSAQ